MDFYSSEPVILQSFPSPDIDTEMENSLDTSMETGLNDANSAIYVARPRDC